MDQAAIAREKLLAAALLLVGNRLQMDASEPGPYDDARSEFDDDVFEMLLDEYVKVRDAHRAVRTTS